MSSPDTTINSSEGEGEHDTSAMAHDTSACSQEIRGLSRKEFSSRIRYLIEKVDSLNEKMDGILEAIRNRRDRSRSSSPVPIYTSKNLLDV